MPLSKIVLSASIFAMMSFVANAADLAPMEITPVEPSPAIFSWTGFYVGVNAGYGWGNIDTSGSSMTTGGSLVGLGAGTFSPPNTYYGADSSANVDGFVGGGQIGYNYQVDSFVLGLEGDYQGSDLRNKVVFSGSAAGPLYHSKSSLDSFGTARVRVGYAFDDILFYGTGGLAVGQAEASLSIQGGVPSPANANPVYHDSDSATMVGWAAGAGVEWAIAHSNWSVKAEYLHVDFGSKTFSFQFPGAAGDTARSKGEVTADVVRAGVNYRF